MSQVPQQKQDKLFVANLPLTKVISYIAVRNQQSITTHKTSIGNPIFPIRNLQTSIPLSMLIQRAVSNTTLPSDQNIDKEYGEVANGKYVLCQIALSIPEATADGGWWIDGEMTAIDGTKAVPEVKK